MEHMEQEPFLPLFSIPFQPSTQLVSSLTQLLKLRIWLPNQPDALQFQLLFLVSFARAQPDIVTFELLLLPFLPQLSACIQLWQSLVPVELFPFGLLFRLSSFPIELLFQL